jgi:hypothetical protein
VDGRRAQTRERSNHAIQDRLAAANERSSFYPVSLASIGKDKEEETEKTKIFEIQDNLGPAITESDINVTAPGKLDRNLSMGQYLDYLKKRVIYGYTEEIENFGAIMFKKGNLSAALEAYDYAVTFGGSKEATKKLCDVIERVFEKPCACDNKHNSSGCGLRGKAMKVLDSLKHINSLKDNDHFSKLLEVTEKVGDSAEGKASYHCAIMAYNIAVKNGSLNARRKLAELSKKLNEEDPYLAKVASKCAKQ